MALTITFRMGQGQIIMPMEGPYADFYLLAMARAIFVLDVTFCEIITIRIFDLKK